MFSLFFYPNKISKLNQTLHQSCIFHINNYKLSIPDGKGFQNIMSGML